MRKRCLGWSCKKKKEKKKKRWKPAKSVSFFLREKKKERRDEIGRRLLAVQAGMEVTGWRRIVGLVRKDMRREVLAG